MEIVHRLWSWLRRDARARELEEEIQLHLELKIQEHIAGGASPQEARRQAQLDFGNASLARERSRERWGFVQLAHIRRDLGYGVRQCVRNPGFTAVVVLTLALGIGANTAIFTLVNAVMLRSIPVRDPQQLVLAKWSARKEPNNIGLSTFGDCTHTRANTTGCTVSYPMFQEIQNRKDVFVDAMAFIGPFQMDLSGNGAATIAQGQLVSGSYFQTLGVTAALGRTLVPEDERPEAASVAVLDYGYWQRAFGASPAVIGRIIRLNNAAFTIVGVAEPGFTRLTPGKSVDLWVSLSQTSALQLKHLEPNDPSDWWLVVVARLKPGVSQSKAEAALDPLFVNEMIHGAKPHWNQADAPRLDFLPVQDALTGIRDIYGEPLLLLMAAVGLILLIACANVAGLMLARAASREREMAVRLAMGVAKRRIIRQLLTESLLVSFLGTALGAVLAPLGVSGLAAFFSENSYEALQLDLHVDARVLLFTIGAALLTGVGFGLAPAFRGARTGVSSQLKGNTTTAAANHGRGRVLGMGGALVVLQVTLSAIVLTGAGLLLRTLENLHRIDPGFDTQNLILFSIHPELAGYKDKRVSDLYIDIQRRIAELPGVTGVSYSSGALLDGGRSSRTMRVEGRADKDGVEVQTMSVGLEYFQTMKIPLLGGRPFTPADTATTNHALVNRLFVQKYSSGRNPLGLHFGGENPTDPKWEIVGVVGDTKYDTLRKDDAPTAYMPLASGGATFAIRTVLAPASLMPAVRNVVNSVDANLPVMRMRTQTDSIDRLLFNERLVARLLGLFAALGLMLACIGLYGLLSYEVERRTREIGIRTALGAQPSAIWSMIVRQGILLVTLGVIAGFGVGISATRLLTSLLYGVRPTDTITFALTACLLLLIGILACTLPAWRAIRIDATTALRCE